MKKILLGILVVVLLIAAFACGTSEKSPSGAPVPRPAPSAPREGGGFDVGAPPPTINIPPPSPTPAPRPAPAPAPAPAPTAPSKGGFGFDSSGQVVPQERMVIINAYMAMVVEDVTASMQQITNLAAQYGGYVVSSDMREDSNRLFGNISIRVVSTGFNNAMAAIRGMAVEVRSESTSGQDVTEEFVDLDARLSNLEITKAALEELMTKTTEKVTDILEVQRELSRVTGEIEQIKARMKFLEQSSDLAFIQVALEQNKLTIEFNADTRSVKEGDSVQFFSIISGGFAPYTFEWDFGDGETSTEANPQHAYRTDGTYTVTLKVRDDKANTADSAREDYITVLTGWDPGSVVSGAWNALVGFGRFLATLGIGLAIFSPVWIVVLVILYFAWWRRRKKTPKQ